ncbi:Hfq-related RNA-binding protein [Leptodesmis sichuanensis]|uniref:Hfq-related RNA-binding protein n=2 Tax=Leptodesmis TaxID=2664261 RepID=UPI0036F2774A
MYGGITMAAELETELPSVRQIQNLIREEQEVEFKLVTGDLLSGKIRWQDNYCIALIDQYDQATIVWRQAIVYIKPRL